MKDVQSEPFSACEDSAWDGASWGWITWIHSAPDGWSDGETLIVSGLDPLVHVSENNHRKSQLEKGISYYFDWAISIAMSCGYVKNYLCRRLYGKE